MIHPYLIIRFSPIMLKVLKMSKLRSVNTHFWNDNYIVDLDPIEKLLFLYLLTNPNTNMLGIFEINIRRISFDTGIDKDMILKIFDRFHEAGKASYIDGYVCLHNFTKHQAYNHNMKVSAVNSYNELPEIIKKQGFIDELLKALKPLPKGSEPIAEIEREVEVETELEIEEERGADKSAIPTLQEVMNYFDENGYNPEVGKKAYNIYNTSLEDYPQRRYWRDSRDNLIKNWKLKMQSVWFKPENVKGSNNGQSYEKGTIEHGQSVSDRVDRFF